MDLLFNEGKQPSQPPMRGCGWICGRAFSWLMCARRKRIYWKWAIRQYQPVLRKNMTEMHVYANGLRILGTSGKRGLASAMETRSHKGRIFTIILFDYFGVVLGTAGGLYGILLWPVVCCDIFVNKRGNVGQTWIISLYLSAPACRK